MEGTWDPPAGSSHVVSAAADPREGSAAWRAEQIATGQIAIPVGARPLGAASSQKAQVDATPLIASLLKIGVVLAIAFFVWFRFFHSTAPSSEEIQAAFVPVVGYEYGAADSPGAKAVDSFVTSYLEEEEISDFQVREIFSGGRVIGFAMIGGFEYSDDTRAEFESGAVQDGAKQVTLGATGSTFTAYEAAQPPAYGVVWMADEGYVYGVFTNYPTHARTIATTLGTAAL